MYTFDLNFIITFLYMSWTGECALPTWPHPYWPTCSILQPFEVGPWRQHMRPKTSLRINKERAGLCRQLRTLPSSHSLHAMLPPLFYSAKNSPLGPMIPYTTRCSLSPSQTSILSTSTTYSNYLSTPSLSSGPTRGFLHGHSRP